MIQWLPSPDKLSIASEEVHIWQADLNLPWSKIEQLQQTLSPEEQQRADRYRFDRDRQHFIAGRGILRQILSNYVNYNPSKLQFTYSQKGKPSLLTDNFPGKLEFNLSHSRGKALYAIACNRKIGIDLEYIRPVEVQNLAKRFFCPAEYHALTQLPKPQQEAAFFHAWTCKEAYLKATGEGIVGLEQVEVSIHCDRPAKIVKIAGNAQAASSWQIEKISINSGYMAALVMQSPGNVIKYWRWTSSQNC